MPDQRQDNVPGNYIHGHFLCNDPPSYFNWNKLGQMPRGVHFSFHQNLIPHHLTIHFRLIRSSVCIGPSRPDILPRVEFINCEGTFRPAILTIFHAHNGPILTWPSILTGNISLIWPLEVDHQLEMMDWTWFVL